ncbi:NADH:flavin oxidoreductase/NADH oxidase [Mesorhizobium australicum]|uniref:oxidoreductase n=1 Tax=Mesorhizobium australicum TaxID=536018 RepID=UPI00333D520F
MALNLFSEIKIGQMRARNRLMMSPMSQNSASDDGNATNWHMVHYGSRAVGGCGIVLMEDTAISPAGRVSSRALCLYEEHHATSLQPVVSFCQENGAKVGIQLAHAGRKAWRDRRTADIGRVSTGTDAFAPDWGAPAALDDAGIGAIIQAFQHSAVLALRAGFDFIEIHAAHGYLLHQFLSPVSNNREDSYGVPAAGRRRLLLEVIAAVRAVWPPDKPLFCRLPAEDGHPDGLALDEVIEVAAVLGKLGVDMIDVAASNVSPECRIVTSGDMQRVSTLIRKKAGLATTTAGDPNQAQDLLDSGTLDLIAVGRPLLTNPYWLLAHADDEQRTRLWPRQYTLAMPKSA